MRTVNQGSLTGARPQATTTSQPAAPTLAVIGTGLGGLAAAWLLRQRFQVTLFEQHPRPGMGVFVVDYHSRGQTTRIDIPTRVFCDGYYPNLLALLRAVGVRLHATDHSAAYADADGEVFFHYGNLRAFGRAWSYPKGRRSLGREGRELMLDSTRFFARAQADLRQHGGGMLAGQTLGEYLDRQMAQQWVGAAFVQRLLLPALSVICTCDYASVRGYPADLLLGYLCSGVMRQGVVRAEKGVDDIVGRLLDGIQVICGQAVQQVDRDPTGLGVVTADGTRRVFDRVVVAAQAQQAAAMLDAFRPYQTLLEQVPFEASSMLVHTDPALLPRSRLPLSPVTYHLPPDPAPRPEVTVDLSKAFPTYRRQASVFQTWNPLRTPQAQHHIAEAGFTRPLVTPQSRQAMRRLRELQQRDTLGLWFCGAYVADRVPLLEAAAASAVDVAQQLGATVPWSTN